MQSKALTVSDYLDELSPEKRSVLKVIRELILENLQPGFEEGMHYGMIGYGVPLSRYPNGYLGNPAQPLPYIGLASQKNYFSLYLIHVYGDPRALAEFQKGFAKAGKKLDMGKSCVRFKKLEDLPLGVIGSTVAACSVEDVINMFNRYKK